ncbi:MAG: hypothetical protein AB1437_21690 [Pseudomonadota bacterium]
MAAKAAAARRVSTACEGSPTGTQFSTVSPAACSAYSPIAPAAAYQRASCAAAPQAANMAARRTPTWGSQPAVSAARTLSAPSEPLSPDGPPMPAQGLTSSPIFMPGRARPACGGRRAR